MLLGLNNPNLTGDQLKNIEKNRIDVQKGILDITANNPTADAKDIIDSYHESFTGFDSSGNMIDPFVSDPFAGIPDYSQPTQSVFDEGGIFSGSFFANQGGRVPASNGGK